MAYKIPATLISNQMKDLLKHTPKAVREACDDPNTQRDYDRRSVSKGLAARAIAARALVRAMDEGSVGHLETILERTEGKVANPDAAQGGTLIQFNFSLAPGQLVPGSVGEVLQGVLAAQTSTTAQVGNVQVGQVIGRDQHDQVAQPLALNPSNPTASSEQHTQQLVPEPGSNHNS